MTNTIGERIRARRVELGWSLRDLSDRMGYANHSTVARVESGAVDLPQSKIVKFAEVLSVSVAYLMGLDEKIKADPVGMAERHFEIIMDEDISDIFEDFKKLTPEEKQMVKKIVRSMANEEA